MKPVILLGFSKGLAFVHLPWHLLYAKNIRVNNKIDMGHASVGLRKYCREFNNKHSNVEHSS